MLKLKTFVFNAFAENTYVIYDETKQCVIIDPGCSSQRESELLFDFIDTAGLKPLMVINTHGHIDHIMGNADVKKRYGIKVEAHAEAFADFARAKHQAAMFGLPFAAECEMPDAQLDEGELIAVGNSHIEVISTPGHAKGSISLFAEMEGWVFTGDALFCRSIGRTDLDGGNYDELRDSIRGKIFHLPDDTTVLPGHGESSTIGDEQRFNLYID